MRSRAAIDLSRFSPPQSNPLYTSCSRIEHHFKLPNPSVTRNKENERITKE
jgi:hypothetical protein